MPFTDDDLARLESNFRKYITKRQTIALLARLEAAEKVCEYLGNIVVRCNHKPEGWDATEKVFNEWRKAVGK